MNDVTRPRSESSAVKTVAKVLEEAERFSTAVLALLNQEGWLGP